MRKLFLILAVLFSLGAAPVFAQTPEAPRSTAVIVQELRDNYKAQQVYIDELRATNSSKDVTIDELRVKVDDITNKWTDAIEEDSKKTTEIITLTTKNRLLIKWLIIAVAILGGFFLLHIVILFLRVKWNIILPYWLNAIL
jgi:hypothetical protein